MVERVDLHHLSAKLVKDLDFRLGMAKSRVEADEALTLGVALALKVGRDKDGIPTIVADEKDGGSRKTSWTFSSGQGELDFDEAPMGIGKE